MRKLILGLLGLIVLAVLVAGAGLLWAHLSLRGERRALPPADRVATALSGDTDRPVSLRWINTASQDMPRSAVLEPELDPTPDAPYRMSHPSFVLEWEDGRILLVDVGMTPEQAKSFGGPAELIGARPIEPHEPTAARLGSRRDDVAGIVFSHMHVDHVQGVVALCEGRRGPIRVFGTKGQLVRTNYTTQPGRDTVGDAACVELVAIGGASPLIELEGFPGVRVIEAAGHTPGSQVVVAEVDDGTGPQRYVFTGDVANARDGIRLDLPKPWYYSAFIVPEDTERLGEVRRFVHTLNEEHGFTVLVQHDELAIEESGVPPWAPQR